MSRPFGDEPLTKQDRTLHEQVRAALLEMILAADLADESPLPPEVRLQDRFGVSRGTLRHALAELERDGLLRREPGRGTFVNTAVRLRQVVWEQLRPYAKPDSRFGYDFTSFVPDYEGSDAATTRIRRLPEYRDAHVVFVTPDNNLESLRSRALGDGKRLVVASYAMRRGFVLLDHNRMRAHSAELAATLDGLERVGTALDLAALRAVRRIDLVVSGAAAVTREGVHFGKGHGFLDLEWGVLREIGLVDGDTPVVVSVHGSQLVEERVPRAPFDCTCDVIVTPEATLRCTPPLPKPDGIFWDRLDRERLGPVAYLDELETARARG